MDLRERKLHEIKQRLRYMRAAAPPPGSLASTIKKPSSSSVAQNDIYYLDKASSGKSSPIRKQSLEVLNLSKVERSPSNDSHDVLPASERTKVQHSTPPSVQSQASISINLVRFQSSDHNAEVEISPLVFELSQRGLLPQASQRKSSMKLRREVEAKLLLGASN